MLYLLHCTSYCWSLYRLFSLTSSTYNGELVVNEKKAFQHVFGPCKEEFLINRFNGFTQVSFTHK